MSLEDRKRKEFKQLMECKWYKGKPIQWMLDKETLEEVDDFLTMLMAEVRLQEKNYIIKNYEISSK